MTSTTGVSSMSSRSPQLVNGVFQGGGAKMIGYVGALRAIEERGLWFGSVSGASAGAIAASLIAAGMNAADLEDAIPAGLDAARSPIAARLGKAVIGHATSVFEGRGLRTWLDAAYHERIGRTDDAPVTFAELYDWTKIELYVLSLDLATGLPVVFSRRTTPHVEVAGAVVASSSIPGAFPAGRAVFGCADSGFAVHQLVDGGAYANYPSFVFDDRSFRVWMRDETRREFGWDDDEDTRCWTEEEARPVVGFVLSDPEPLEHLNSIGFVPMEGEDVNRRFDQGPTYTSPKKATYLFGAVLSSDWARLTISVALLVWVATSIAVLPIGFRRFSTWLAGWMPDVLYPFAVIGMLAVVTLAVVVAIGAIAVLVLAGRLIADTLLPAIKGVLGVPLEVPPWLGMGDDAVLIRVPHDTLKTVKFKVDDATIARAVKGAEASVRAQLADPVIGGRLEALLGGTSQEAVDTPRGDRSVDSERPEERSSPTSAVALVAATGVIGLLAWWATNLAGAEAIGPVLVAVVLALALGGAALWFVAGSAGRRSASRARHGVGMTKHEPVGAAGPRGARLWVVGGALFVVAGAVLSAVAMSDRASTTSAAVVTSAESQPGVDGNSYEVRVASGQTFSVTSNRHLRLGERAFVEIDDTTGVAALVGALDNYRFAVSVVLWALGLGLITAGIRRQRYETRCRRLASLITTWDRD